VVRAMWVVDIVRRWDWDISFSLPFLEGDGWGGGGNGLSVGCSLWDGSAGGGGARRDLGLDNSGGGLEVDAAKETGGIRLKIEAVDSVARSWCMLLLGGRVGVVNTGGFIGRTGGGFRVLHTDEASRSGVVFLPKAPGFIKGFDLLGNEEEAASTASTVSVSNTDLKLMFAGGLYATLELG
jgi:hypothetical protein